MSRPGRRCSRSGARPGDEIWVTGTIGDGALGLRVALGKLADPSGYLLDRYRLPRPRVGLELAGIASAAMDVSDGLVQDLGASLLRQRRSARRSGPIGCRCRRRRGRRVRTWLETCLTGGDDYELLLAVPPDRRDALLAAASRAGVPVTRIGGFHAGPCLR